MKEIKNKNLENAKFALIFLWLIFSLAAIMLFSNIKVIAIGITVIDTILIIFFVLYYIQIIKKNLNNPEIIIKWMINNDIDMYFKDPGRRYDMPKYLIPIINYLENLVGNTHSEDRIEKQMEYRLLQNQINPHFLYNTLESIRGQALIEGVSEIAEMIEKLSKFFRYSISSKRDFVTIQDELNNIQDYFFIQQYRFEEKFKLAILVEEDEILDYYIPKLTFQPIVENAIFHGLEKRYDDGKITIRIVATAKKLIITIADNGVGITETKLEEINNKLTKNIVSFDVKKTNKKGGIALFNINRRIKLYFGEEYGVTVTSNPNLGTDVEVLIPIVNELEKLKYKDE